jgi:microcystin-dependent protein
MSDAYTGEIRILPYTFAPLDWAWCDGQLFPVAQNPALFSIVSDIYGGDGHTSFGLPDLRGRLPLHCGDGPNLTPRMIGEMGGYATIPLAERELPAHSHAVYVDWAKGEANEPNGRFIAGDALNPLYKVDPQTAVQMDEAALAQAGSGYPHDNIQPFLALNFCICLDGFYPPRS